MKHEPCRDKCNLANDYGRLAMENAELSKKLGQLEADNAVMRGALEDCCTTLVEISTKETEEIVQDQLNRINAVLEDK